MKVILLSSCVRAEDILCKCAIRIRPSALHVINSTNTYLSAFGDRSDVILVSTKDLLQPAQPTNTSSVLFFVHTGGDATPGMFWPCGATNVFDCRKPELWERNAFVIKDWNVIGYKIDYCLTSENSLEKLCSVNYSLSIMAGMLTLIYFWMVGLTY